MCRFQSPCFFFLQGEHKVFAWLQTSIARKLRGMQTFFLTCNTTHEVFFLENDLSNGTKYICIPRSFLVINDVCNQGKTLCSPCI